jgi:DNA-binding LytR/AlgR family response regulator
MNAVKILVVEDDFIIAEDIAQILQNTGYTIIGIIAQGEAVMDSIEQERPDLILLDITLAGKKTGIEVGEEIYKYHRDIPFIYITSYSDQNTVEKAKHTFPSAYMTKPFDERDLEIAIELAIFNFSQAKTARLEHSEPLHSKSEQEPFILTDCIFVKKENRFEKIELRKILYIEASGHYLIFYTIDGKQFMIGGSLKSFMERITQKIFIQVHRSFIVNIENITGFDEDSIYFEKRLVPLSKTFKKDFIEKFRFF